MDISESKLRNILMFILEYNELIIDEYYNETDFDSKQDKDNFFNAIKDYIMNKSILLYSKMEFDIENYTIRIPIKK